MAKRINQSQIGREKVVIQRHSFVSETRKDVILKKRQEARLYKINRTMLWAKSIGAQTQATNFLTNASYQFLQTVNDIQAFFVTDNLLRSLAARYAWTKGGKFLANAQNKVVPSGFGPLSRFMRVQAGRQSKKILSGMSANLFVNSEVTIVNVKKMEADIKRQLATGAGLGRRWAVTTAAFAVSGAPDPYSHAQKIMGNNKKRSMDSFDFESNQAFLKNSDMFTNLLSAGMNPAEAKHYMKYVATGQNPNQLLNDFRNKVSKKRMGDMMINGTTGKTKPIQEVLDDLSKSIDYSGTRLTENYRRRRNKGDFRVTGTRIIENDKGEKVAIPKREYENFAFGNERQRNEMRDFLAQFTDDEIDEFVTEILGGGQVSAKFGNPSENENIGSRFNLLWNLGREVGELNRLRRPETFKHKIPRYGGRLKIGKMFAKSLARETPMDGYTRNALQFLRLVSKNMSGVEAGMGFNPNNIASKIMSDLLGTNDLSDYNEMTTLVGDENLPQDRRGTNYKVIKSSNNPNDPNYIPSRFQIQKAIHIDDEFKGDVFMNFSVSFGGKTPRSRGADAIPDAQQIEFGGRATSPMDWKKMSKKDDKFKVGNRADNFIYPRTLFMNRAAHQGLKAVGINAEFRTPTRLIDAQNIKGKIQPTQKQKGFTILMDKRLRDLMNAEVSATQLRGRDGRVAKKRALESLFDDPMAENKRSNVRSFPIEAIAIRKLQRPGDRMQIVEVDDEGVETVKSMKMIDDPVPDNQFKPPHQKILDAYDRYGPDAVDKVIRQLQNYIRTNKNFRLGPITINDIQDGNIEKIFMTRFPSSIYHGMGVQDGDTLIDIIAHRATEKELLRATIIQDEADKVIALKKQGLKKRISNEVSQTAGLSVQQKDDLINMKYAQAVEDIENETKLQVAEELAKVKPDAFLEIAAEETIEEINERYQAIARTKDSGQGIEVYKDGRPTGNRTPIEVAVQEVLGLQQIAVEEKIAFYMEENNISRNEVFQLPEFKEYMEKLNNRTGAELEAMGVKYSFTATGALEAELIRIEAEEEASADYGYKEFTFGRFLDPMDMEAVDETLGSLPGAFEDRNVQGDPTLEAIVASQKSLVKAYRDLRRQYKNSGINTIKIEDDFIDSEVIVSTDRTKNLSFAKGSPLRKNLIIIANELQDEQSLMAFAAMLFSSGDNKFINIALGMLSRPPSSSDDIIDFNIIDGGQVAQIRELIAGLETHYGRMGNVAQEKKLLRDFINRNNL